MCYLLVCRLHGFLKTLALEGRVINPCDFGLGIVSLEGERFADSR